MIPAARKRNLKRALSLPGWEQRPGVVLATVVLSAIIWIGFLAPTHGMGQVPAGTPGASPALATPGSPLASPQAGLIATPTGSPVTSEANTGGPTDERPAPGARKGKTGEGFPNLFKDYPAVEDKNRILSNSQRKILSGDATRLTRHGIPTLILLRRSSDSRAESTSYADAVRSERNIESEEGADNGLLILVTINPDSPRAGSMVISYGDNTLPKGALSPESIQQVYNVSMLPLLQRGKIFDATRLGVRQFIYLETYYPEPQPPLDGIRKTVHSILTYAAPLTTVFFGCAFVLIWLARPKSTLASIRMYRRVSLLAITTIVIVAIAGVYARSGAAAGSALLLLAMVCFHLVMPAGEQLRSRRHRIIRAVSRSRKRATARLGHGESR